MQVLPANHPITNRKLLSVADLRDQPFVFFTPTAGALAYQKPISLCEQHGFRPRVVQEAPQWLTILRLVGAGLGVSIAPACVLQITTPEIVCRTLRGASVRSNIELAYRTGDDRAIVRSFRKIARASFATQTTSRKPSASKP